MNPTQTQTSLAPMISFLAGLLAGKGVFGFDSTVWTAIIGGVFGLGATVWGAIAARKSAMVATVNNMPEVQGVVTTPTMAGRDLAKSIPSPTVAVAGTPDAKAIAASAGATS